MPYAIRVSEEGRAVVLAGFALLVKQARLNLSAGVATAAYVLSVEREHQSLIEQFFAADAALAVKRYPAHTESMGDAPIGLYTTVASISKKE